MVFYTPSMPCRRHQLTQVVQATAWLPLPHPNLHHRKNVAGMGGQLLGNADLDVFWKHQRISAHHDLSLRCCKYLHAAGSLSGRKSSSLCQCTRPRPNASIRKMPASEIACLRFCTQQLQIESNSHLHRPPKNWKPNFAGPADLVGGFNPIEKYSSKWESSPGRGGNKTYLSCHHLEIFVPNLSYKYPSIRPSMGGYHSIFWRGSGGRRAERFPPLSCDWRSRDGS